LALVLAPLVMLLRPVFRQRLSLASMVAGTGSVVAVEQKIMDANQLTNTDLAAGERLWVPTK
jgi:hypothetical protein